MNQLAINICYNLIISSNIKKNKTRKEYKIAIEIQKKEVKMQVFEIKLTKNSRCLKKKDLAMGL